MKDEYAVQYLKNLEGAIFTVRQDLEKFPNDEYLQGKEMAFEHAIELFAIWSRA